MTPWDTIAARDQHSQTDIRLDSQVLCGLIANLSSPERVVMELYFGINESKSYPMLLIARKLGRSRWWVESRLNRGILQIRTAINTKQRV